MTRGHLKHTAKILGNIRDSLKDVGGHQKIRRSNKTLRFYLPLVNDL